MGDHFCNRRFHSLPICCNLLSAVLPSSLPYPWTQDCCYHHSLRNLLRSSPGWPILHQSQGATQILWSGTKSSLLYVPQLTLQGPIIRIGPDEVHVLDPSFIDKVYSMQGRWDKNQGYKRYGNLGHLATIPHALHRNLRAPLNPFFSKQRIAVLEPRIHAQIPRIERRLDEFARSGEPLDVELFFSAVTMDVASEYAMGKTYGNLDMQDFNKHYHGMIPRMGPTWNLSKQLPWLPTFFERLPSDWIRRLEPGMVSFKDFGKQCELEIRSIMAMLKASSSSKEMTHSDTSPTIFHAMLSNPSLPATEESINYMRDEAIVIIGAATVTTSMTFTIILFHLSHNRKILANLRSELDGVPGERPFTLRQIEQLPYLNAVIQEALRMMPGGPNRIGRIAVDHSTTYTQFSKDGTTVDAEYVIPPGYEMSMTQWHLSRDPNIFERPDDFIPDRWIEVNEDGRLSLEKAFAPFVKGTRNCLGMKYGTPFPGCFDTC